MLHREVASLTDEGALARVGDLGPAAGRRQDGAAPQLGRIACVTDEGHGALRKVIGGVKCSDRCCFLGRAHSCLCHDERIAGQDPLAQVVCDRTLRGLPRGRERFADPPVQMSSAGTADLLEKGLAHQRVRERERARNPSTSRKRPGLAASSNAAAATVGATSAATATVDRSNFAADN